MMRVGCSIFDIRDKGWESIHRIANYYIVDKCQDKGLRMLGDWKKEIRDGD